LAKQRLERIDDEKATLIQSDFLQAAIPGSYDVVLGLGYFEYIHDPPPHVPRMREVSAPGGSVVASFQHRDCAEGPIRTLRYEATNNCSIVDYPRDGLNQLFAVFASVEIRPGSSGFLLRATA